MSPGTRPGSGPLAAARRAVAVLALAAAPALALAAQTCSILGATGVAFGAYDPMATAPLDGAGSVSWKCTGSTTVVITASAGAAGSFAPRAMVSGTEQLAYNVYVDAARSSILGDGTAGTATLVVAGGGLQTQAVYGRVFARQDVAAGGYADVLTFTFNF